MSQEARPARRNFLWVYLQRLQRRRSYIWLAMGLLAVVAVLLAYSWPVQDWGKNLALNLSADLIGTIIVVFTVSPFLSRAEIQGDHVRDGFDRGAFIRQAGDARRQIQILELWTDLLQENYREKLLKAFRDALKQQVTIRMLLLNPDGRAAEQRADELLQQTNVVGDILDNLRTLHDFVYGEIPEVHRRNIDVRVYSALPPVQMYQVDTQVVVSFYPVNVTSWNATQYVTSSDSQLGRFVGDKFEELWKARSTRTLEQFWETTVIVSAGQDEQRYRVHFATHDERVFLSGRMIIADHATTGITGLRAHFIDDNVTGTSAERGPYAMVLTEKESEVYNEVQDLFMHKYGVEHHVFLELVDPGQRSRLWRRGS